MNQIRTLYPSSLNPLLIRPTRALPKEVAIIGAGTIGPDIGYYLKSALPQIKLVLVDISEPALQNAQRRYADYAQKAVARRKVKDDQAKAILDNIVYTLDYGEIRNCDLVIESATENIALKQKIFQVVEDNVSENTIITSNTSSIPADRIFAKMRKPDRTTVTHFFAPAWRSLAVEVINWQETNKEVLDYLFWLFAVTGKAPVITDNVLCFMLDRIFDNWCNEAAYLLDVATAAEVGSTVEEFAFQGPFYVLNMGNGNPIIFETNTLQMEEGSHYKPANVFRSVDKWMIPRPGTKVDVFEEIRNRVRDRMLGILFSQSFDIIDRGIGTKGDLNFGSQIALGFKKGPLDIMRDLGEEEVNRIIKKFDEERPGFPKPKMPYSFYQDFYRHIIVDEFDRIKIITIRRPQALNAMSDELNNEILDVLKKNDDRPEVKGFVITGYGTRSFSAGGDIGKFPQTLGNPAAAAQYAKDCAEVHLFMDKMKNPMVAAVNGLALGGGLELAIRCHSIVSTKDATLQFPEITLGILPGVGGCIVPYRKWPQGAKLFHEMICLARPIGAKEAAEVGMVNKIVEGHSTLIAAALEEVKNLQGNIKRIPEGKVAIPDITIPEQPMAGKLPLSREAISIIARTIKKGSASQSLAEALEIGYQGAAEIGCTDAAKEGISAFLEKRKPNFIK